MTEPVVWKGLDHAALYEAAVNSGLGPAASMDVEEQWRRIGMTVTRIEGDLTAALAASESEWTGMAADAARTGLTPLGRWALDAAGDAASTAAAVTDQALASAVLRSQLRDNPPVPSETIMETLDRNATYGTRGPSADEAAVQQAAQAERDGAAAKAVADARVYEKVGFESRRTLDFWTVPPTVTVEAASAGGSGAGPGGPRLSGGSFADAAPGPTAVPLPAGVPDGSGSPAASALRGGGTLSPGSLPPGSLPPGSVSPGSLPPGPLNPGPVPPGPSPLGDPAGAGPSALAPAGRINDALDGRAQGPAAARPADIAAGGRGVPGPYDPANPTASPIGRAAPAAGARGTGPGPWTRAAADAATAAGRGGPFRPVVPAAPRPAPLPDWRSVVTPPSEPGRPASPNPGEPGRAPQPAVGTQTAAGPRASPAASHGLYPPMAGAGGTGGNERRRPSYLIDDSDAFVDHRWVQPAVITPDDLVPDDQGRLPGQ